MEGNKIYNALFGKKEVELSSEKVELGSLQDFETLYDNVNKTTNKAFNEASQLSKSVNSIINDALSNISRAEKQAGKLENQAKDLGLSLPKEVHSKISSIKEDQDMLLKLRAALKSLDSAY